MAAITSAEILLKYSTTAGSAGNSGTGTPAGSLGKYISTTVWPGPGALNDLFDDISGAENSAGMTDYRCIFVHNSNTANVLQNAVVFQTAEVAGGASITLAVDSTPATVIGSTPVQALTIANETTAPAALTFVGTAVSAATGLALGNISPGQCRAFWIKRTISATSAVSNDGITINVAGDTGNL